MPARDALWRDHYRVRWLRPDAHRWIKPDAGRFLKPGVAIAAVFPAIEAKYSPDQPRVSAGKPGGGQWTIDGDGGDDDSGSDDEDSESFETDFIDELLEWLRDLFSRDDSQKGDTFSFLDLLSGSDQESVQRVSDNKEVGAPDPFPKIPEERPGSSEERTALLKDLAGWIGRNAGRIAGAADAIYGAAEQVDWLAKEIESIKSYRDPPRSFEELQEPVGSKSQRGYQDHHVVERNAVRDGISRAQVNSSENVIRIPVLKHYEITGYYNSRNIELPDGTRGSPREYLRDKSFEERHEFGLGVLRDYKVLK